MKICILSPLYPCSANPHFGIYVHEQAKHLAGKGNKVCVITVGDLNDKPHEFMEGVEVCRVRINELLPFKNKVYHYYDSLQSNITRRFSMLYKNMKFAFLMLRYFLNLDRKNNFDVIHSHFVGRLTLLIGIVANLKKKPFVVTAYGIGMLADTGFKKAMNKFYLSLPSKVVCISKYVANIVSKYTDKRKIAIVYYGVNPNKLVPSQKPAEFRKKLGLKNERVLLSVANLEERKGIDIILNSLPAIIKSCPNLKYFIIGDGPQKKNLHRLVKELDLVKYVTFIDYVNDKDLANFYNICDIFILMSRTIKEKGGIEGFGIVYVEASYFGKPVIGGRSGGTADSILNGFTGYRIEPTNQKELVSKLLKLLKSDSLRKELGSNGRKWVMKELLHGRIEDKLIKIYGSLLNNKK